MGQVVRLDLRIAFPARATLPTFPLRLHIPWLNREEIGFQWLLPMDQWICQQSRVRSRPVFQIGPHMVGAVAHPDTHTFQFSWYALIQEPDPLQPDGLRFAPVYLEGNPAVRSNDLQMQVRPLHIPPEGEAIRLGVGEYQVEARVEPSRVKLGQECLLLVRVRGTGYLPVLATPSLFRLPGWQSPAFYLEAAPETWEEGGTVRCFRYRLLPRRATRHLILPPLPYLCLSPARGEYVRHQAEMPFLQVEEALPTVQDPHQTRPYDSLPDRLRWIPPESDGDVISSWRTLTVTMVVGGPAFVLLLLLVLKGIGERWNRGQGSTPAGRLAWHTLRISAQTLPERVTLALAIYVQMRYGFQGMEPTYGELALFLRQRQLPRDLDEILEKLFQRLEVLRFAPGESGQEEQLLGLAEQLFLTWERVP